MKRPLAYITAPWSNSQYENAENAAAYCRQVYDAGYSPICPVLFLPTFLKDEIPQEHKDGLDMARDYLRRSHVLVVCGHGIDETVKNDIATAERLRITATTLDGILAVKGQGRGKGGARHVLGKDHRAADGRNAGKGRSAELSRSWIYGSPAFCGGHPAHDYF